MTQLSTLEGVIVMDWLQAKIAALVKRYGVFYRLHPTVVEAIRQQAEAEAVSERELVRRAVATYRRLREHTGEPTKGKIVLEYPDGRQAELELL